MQNTIKILVDLKKEIYRFDQAQQGDDVILDLTILENGVAKDLTGETVELIYINANNTIASVTGDKVVVNGNNVKITCPRDCTRSYGIAKFQLKIINTYQVSTFPIALTIVPGVDQNQQISQNISTILEDLTAKNIECGETLNSLNEWVATHGDIVALDTRLTAAEGTIINHTSQLADITINKKVDDLLYKMINKEEVKIVCFGDSVTWGYNTGAVQVPNPYPQVLQNKLNLMYDYVGITVYNEGIPGATTVDGINNFNSKVVAHLPDLVIIMFGLNDNNMGVSIIDYQNNIRTMLDNAKKNNIKVILMSPTPSVEGISSLFNRKNVNYAKAIKEVAIERQVDFVDMHKEMSDLFKSGALDATYYNGTSVHFTNTGYALIADILIKEKLYSNIQPYYKDGEFLSFQSPFVVNTSSATLVKDTTKLKKFYYLDNTKQTEKIGFGIYNDKPNRIFKLLTRRNSIGGLINLYNFGQIVTSISNNGNDLFDYEIDIALGIGLHYFELKGVDVEIGKYFITSGGYIYKPSSTISLPQYEPLLLENSWVNNGDLYENAMYYKTSENLVGVVGLIKSGITISGTVIANLPIDFRPLKTHIFVVATSDGTTVKMATVEVLTNGDIISRSNVANSYLSLDGIHFLAGQ